MHPEILKKAKKLQNQLSELIPKISENISEKEVLEKWNSYQPTKKKIFAIGEDGSINKKHYLGFYLYAVSGFSYGQKNGKKIEELVGDINISVIKITEKADSYFRLLMFLSELKSIVKLANKEKADLLLIDGTLSSKFIVPPPKTNWFIDKEFGGELANAAGSLIKDIKEKLFDFDITSFSEEIQIKAQMQIKERLNEKPRRDILEAFLSKLVYFEYLLVLYELFYGLEHNPLVIGVAKTSTDTELFNRSIPDIRILHKFIRDTGYTEPITISFESKAKQKTQEWEFSEVFEKLENKIASALKDITIKYFYAKYNIGRTISLIEVYENPNRETVNPKEILDYLNYLASGSYPFYLIRADKQVRITNEDMKNIEIILGLQNELTGREELI
ncbi:DNA double-strand break repair nuclease NurA [Hydrogenothermus marinus]|uniref:NurA domain-containing protein n=1 Tax=Hydrogenothermus marinus TaxID=133270 RepID=A0A3M0BAF1_9AQUI|nr:DNA double-strand break repair nuclease NurA [Hydrogenothermus marinus]RMA93139.1 NurA domain-containing protein [Hydrogenothermus marinus]